MRRHCKTRTYQKCGSSDRKTVAILHELEIVYSERFVRKTKPYVIIFGKKKFLSAEEIDECIRCRIKVHFS